MCQFYFKTPTLWTVSNKIKNITKANGTSIKYTYDASGNRISKIVTTASTGDSTYYVRDASGNVMSVYNKKGTLSLAQTEIHLFGSSRLAVNNSAVDVQNCASVSSSIVNFTRGNKFFELSNHFGNVLVTISDKILQVSANGTAVAYYNADVITAKNYYPFGMQMPDSVYRTDGAYFMNGTTLSPDSSYTVSDASNNFTVEFWAKPTATHEIDSEGYIWGGIAGQRYLVAPGFLDGTSVGMGVSVGTNGVSVYEHGPSYIPALLVWQSPSAITDWIHVAVVYQNKQPKLYINGQLVRTGLVSSKEFVYPSFNFTGYVYGTYQGYVDEMRIWKEARTQQQIKDNRYGAIAVPQTNLSGYWPLSASTGSTLVDISGNNRSVPLNNNTGRLTGNAGGNTYRYGFNGKENDNDVKGDGNQQDYGMRIYDPRLGKFLSSDPVTGEYPELTPYQFASNTPIRAIDLDGLEMIDVNMEVRRGVGTPGMSASAKNRLMGVYNEGQNKGATVGTAIVTVVAVDIFVTKGWLSRIIMGSQVIGAFEHNRANTPERKAAKDERSKEALANAFIGWGVGKLFGVGINVTASIAKTAANRFNFAKSFYKEAGFAEEQFIGHAKGIDLTEKVFETTLKKGTKLEQWTYLDQAGKPKLGNYYAFEGTDPTKIGLPLEGRVKTTVVLKEDTKFLQSTAGDIENWNKPGSGEMLKGGAPQLFQTNVKLEVIKNP